MGNCLVIQPTTASDDDDRVITITRMDGKMLTYVSPVKVYQILEVFPGHTISDPLSIPQQLGLMSDMLPGRQYYMLPVETQMDDQGSVVRVKLVITKKELKEMLTREASALDELLVSGLQASDDHDRRKEIISDEESLRGWRPSLESIPEGC